MCYKKVANTFIRQTNAIYSVRFTDSTLLETTWNHPFRVLKADANGQSFSIENTQWKEAKDLLPGDVSLSADGSKLLILSVEIDQREETVYNFEVEDFHTYFVGEVGVWVQNEKYSLNKEEIVVLLKHSVVAGATAEANFLSIDPSVGLGLVNATEKARAENLRMAESGEIPLTAGHNGQGDAVRHTLWNAEMTANPRLGADFAREFSTAHEYRNPKIEKYLQPRPIEIEMDLRNNKVGQKIGMENPGASSIQLQQRVQEANKTGKLFILKPKIEFERQLVKKYKIIYKNSEDKDFVAQKFDSELYGHETNQASYETHQIVPSNTYKYYKQEDIKKLLERRK